MFSVRAYSWLLLGGFISACAALPPPPEFDGIQVSDIVDAVQCELAAVYGPNTKHANALSAFYARTRLGLRVSVETKAGATLTLTPPPTDSTITVPLGTKHRGNSLRNAVVEFDVHMRDLDPALRAKAKPKPGPQPIMPDCPRLYSGLPEAAGSLGLTAWARTVAEAVGRNDFAGLHGTTYNLEFTVERGGNGGFTFKDARVSLNVAIDEISRETYNQLTVTFAPETDETDKPTGKRKVAPPGGTNRQLQEQLQPFIPFKFKLDTSGRIIGQ